MTASIKHSIRYFGVNAEDVRVPCTKGMKGKDWSWAATCTPCGWDSESAVAHAEIVELVAAHKAEATAPVAAPEPAASDEVTKAAAKKVGLPVGSATALLAFAKDAGNWGGNPLVGGNVDFGRSNPGYITKLVAAGYVITTEDDGDVYLHFTPAGIDAALALGAPESLNNYR